MKNTEGNNGGSLERVVRPLYPSRDYREYCADQKRKGLTRRHWKDLPEMWKEELAFRRELEDALNERPNSRNLPADE